MIATKPERDSGGGPPATGAGPWSPENLVQFRRAYALRAHLEGFAARQAALRVAGGRSAAELEDRYAEMRQAARKGDYVAFLNADMALHRTITELAGTPTLVAMWDMLEQYLRDFIAWGHRYVFRDLMVIAAAHQHHVDAIRQGQPVVADLAAQAGLDGLWQILAEKPPDPAREGDAIERVCGYIVLNLHERLSLTDLARDVAHVSPSHLARRLREDRGESFTAYIQGLRMRRAASLLRETPLPVREIAERVGYQDPSRFALHFRRHFHLSPTDWRQQTPDSAKSDAAVPLTKGITLSE